MSETKHIAITGGKGQLGFYCAAKLKYHFGYEVTTIDRVMFNDADALASAIENADIVLHLAGVNRGTDDEIRDGNLRIADKLIAACKSCDKAPDIIYVSTIQIDRDNVYGIVKREVGDKLSAHVKASGARYSALVLPNLFGEFSRPYYNNFTGTFCSQLAEGKALTIHNDSPVVLMHYGEIADLTADVIARELSGEIRPQGTPSTVQTVANILTAQYETYKTGVVPEISNPFELRLFNTLRSFIFESQFPIDLVRHADARGSFFECVRAINQGQTSFSTSVPGIMRGDHFHFEKVERFLVVSGKARIRIRRLTDDKIYEYDVDGQSPQIIDMPTLHTHNITNTGDTELLTLFWSNDFFDPEKPDTYVEPV